MEQVEIPTAEILDSLSELADDIQRHSEECNEVVKYKAIRIVAIAEELRGRYLL